MDISIKDFTFDVSLENSALDEISAELHSGGTLAIACSGGADSVFLLFVLLDIFAKFKKQIKVLHFDHHARTTSKRDAEFVKKLSAELEIEAFFGEAISAPKKHSEAEFREMRLAFFKDISKRKNITLIAQGHHSNDASESVLMRLMRGSGLEGICAPMAVSEVGTLKFVRPLLSIDKATIIKILSSASITWCNDETNFQDVHLRNKVRNKVLPTLCEVQPDFSDRVRRSQRLLAEDLNALNNIFSQEFEQLNKNSEQNIVVLNSKIIACRAFLRRAFMKLLTSCNLLDKIRASAIDKFLKNVENAFSKNSNVPVKTSVGSHIVAFSMREMQFEVSEKPTEEFSIEVGIGSCRLPDGRTLRVRKITLGEQKRAEVLAGNNDDSIKAVLDVSCFGDIKKDVLTVRSRMAGDAYAPIGKKNPKKIKDLLNAKKVSILKRKSIFVVCNKKGEILWAPPIAPAEKYKITNSSVALELTLEK